MARKKIKESASAGSTSAGGIASVVQPLNFPLQRRLPHSNIFGYTDESGKRKKDSKRKDK